MQKLIITALFVCLTITAGAADDPGSGVPDLTKGEELTRINERWVGPIGIFCGAWRPRQRSDEQKDIRQLLVLEVEEGSPADSILAEGDVFLGGDGTGAAKVALFESAEWAMIPIAEAITEVEVRKPALLNLLIWRPIKKAESDSADVDQTAVKPPTLDDLIDLDLNDSNAQDADALDDWSPGPKKTGDANSEGQVEGKVQTVTIKLESLV